MTNLALIVSMILATPQLRCGNEDMGRQVYDNLFNEVVRQDRAADAAWTDCKTPAAVAARQKSVRESAIASMGGFPEKTPLNAKTTGRIRKEGYAVEKILFESRPNHYVTAHLFLPDNPEKYKAPYPGVVSPCGHSITGKNAPWYQRVGVVGAMHGLATLVFDPIDQGERRQRADKGWRGSVTGHNFIGWRANLLGWNTAQFRVWDGIRACDYLASRPDVDASRLGVTGLSGGGTLSSYLNALDSRYSAGAPAGFLSTIRDVYDNLGPQDAEQVLFGQTKAGFNHLGIVSLRAPSATMIVATHGDYFPFMGSLATLERAKEVYSAFGAADRVSLMEAPGPHHWYESTRNAAMLWIRRWAGGDAAAWPQDVAPMRRMDTGFKYAPGNSGLAFAGDREKLVTKTGSTLDIPGARSVYDIMRDELRRLDKTRKPPTPESVRSACGAKPLSALSATAVAENSTACADGRAVRLVLSRDDDMTPIPMYAFLPAKRGGGATILFADKPSAALADEAKRLLGEGRAVAVAELRGFGATAKAKHHFYGAKRADETMALLSMTIGENLAAKRAEDAAIAARHFAKMASVAKIDAVAHGAAAIPAAHACFLERDVFASFAAKNPPHSWRAVVENEKLRSSFADTVFGALRTYDWTELARTVAARPRDML